MLIVAHAAYSEKCYVDEKQASEDLRIKAKRLFAEGRSGTDLRAERPNWLMRAQDPDPAFRDHVGVDFGTAGAEASTISQSVTKRVAFKQFEPGIRKVRQTGYALSLGQSLTKDRILALWLDTAEM